MSRAIEILKAEKQRMLEEIADLRKGVREIDVALAAISGSDAPAPSSGQAGSPINDGIIEAIKNDMGTPAAIHSFLSRHLNIETSKHSVSTRLSKMKNEGLIAHDGEKWVLPKKQEGSEAQTSEPSFELGPDTGRERGFPPSAPEGSIPSGSTASRSLEDDIGWEGPIHRRPLDEEIPF
ncbi:MAG: hypothetical protein ACTHKQ_13800 [Mesorhizobium sp.]